MSSSSDFNPQRELEEQLIKKHYGLVVSQALRFIGRDKQLLEDYIQIGLIGLLKAIRKYDKDRSKFSTLASVCIRNELINFINRSLKRDKRLNIIYNSDLLLGLSKEYLTPPDTAFDPESKMLTEEERLIVTRKIQNYPDKEIAEEIGCSRPTLKSKISSIITTLKEHYVG
jgi:RNA polymerase sporulation-specific sigma factor